MNRLKKVFFSLNVKHSESTEQQNIQLKIKFSQQMLSYTDKSRWLSSTSCCAYFFTSKAVSSLIPHALRCRVIISFAEKPKSHPGSALVLVLT